MSIHALQKPPRNYFLRIKTALRPIERQFFHTNDKIEKPTHVSSRSATGGVGPEGLRG